jgi:hypothetical protein
VFYCALLVHPAWWHKYERVAPLVFIALMLRSTSLRAKTTAGISGSTIASDVPQMSPTRALRKTGGVSVILTCQAATEALRSLQSSKVALIQPPWFDEEVNAWTRSCYDSSETGSAESCLNR